MTTFFISFFAAVPLVAQVFIPLSYYSCRQTGFDAVTINTSTDFSLGTFSNTNISGNSVVLSVGQTTGTYTSPVLDIFGGCSPTATWRLIEWKTDLPYGKEMVPSSEVLTDYSGIVTGLNTSLQQFFKLNGTGSIANNATVSASTGVNGTANNSNGSGMAYTSGGKLSSAISLDGTDDAVTMAYTQTGVSDYSISAWVKTSTSANAAIVQNRGAGTGQSITLGIGPHPNGCAAGNIHFGLDTDTIYEGVCTNSAYNDGTWRHVVGVWDGVSGNPVTASQFSIYVNGSAVSTTSVTVGTAPNAPLTGLSDTKIGRHDVWAVNYSGQLDELGIWSRALSATDVQQIYRRGANNVRFQIKTCTSSDCSDVATYKGPDNTSATYFSELNNNTNQASGTGTVLTTFPSMLFSNFSPPLVVDTKRYFQYQATLTTDDTNYQPGFEFVKIDHGCAAGQYTYAAGTHTFTLPRLCTQMTVTASGGGGASGSKVGGGNEVDGGSGGNVVKTFTGLTPETVYSIVVGTGGVCANTGGTGTYNGGAGGISGSAGTSGDGTVAVAGGTGGAGRNGGDGRFGGGGGGGATGGGGDAGGGGAATVLRYLGTDWIIAGGGGASGGGGPGGGTPGVGGSGCAGAVSGDYTLGSAGGNGSGSGGGGGSGGACYCLGGCTSIGSAGGSKGVADGGNNCGAGQDAGAGSLTISFQ